LAAQMDAEPGEADLIDKIVQILGLPHLENRVSIGMLAKLRQALLLPSEIRALTDTMNAAWICGSCRAPIDQGELLTVRRESSNGQRILVIYCARCFDPTFVRCAGGQHQARLSTGFARTLRKCLDAECPECRRAADAPASVQGLPGNPVGRGLDPGPAGSVMPTWSYSTSPAVAGSAPTPTPSPTGRTVLRPAPPNPFISWTSEEARVTQAPPRNRVAEAIYRSESALYDLDAPPSSRLEEER
jgi:hypothetical protein